MVKRKRKIGKGNYAIVHVQINGFNLCRAVAIVSRYPESDPASNLISLSQLKTCVCLTTMGANTSALHPEYVPVSLASLWGLTERAASWISKGTTDLRICTKVDCEELVD